MRKAMKLRIEDGMTIKDACEKAGYSEAGYYLAIKRPHVLAAYEAIEAQFIQTVERRRAQYKARAIEVAADLMERATSEAVRMKAVEFFAGETRQPLVNIDLSGSRAPASGYVYQRPEPSAPDRASGAQGVQDAEIIEQSDDVGE